LVIVRPVATGPSVTVRKASVLSAIGRPASPSARSQAAANPSAGNRAESPVARAALAANPAVQVARLAVRAVVPVGVAPAGAVPRAAGADAR
jgi:hypothetical protein